MKKSSAAVVAGAAAIVLSSTPSFAQSVASAAVYNWTGFYAGVHAGYGAGMKDWGGINLLAKGAFGGVQGGFNQQIGNFVIGVEVDASSGFRGSTFETIAVPFSVSTFNASINSDIRSIASLSMRYGAAYDRFFIYGKLGFAWADEHHSQWQQSTITGVNGSQTVTIGGQETRYGPLIGFGAEYAIYDNWSLKAEYDYYDMMKSGRIPESGTLTSFAGVTSPVSTTVAITQRLHTAKLGVNYHFGPQSSVQIAPSRAPRSYDWTGFYLGLEGVGGRGNMDWMGFGPFDNYRLQGWLGGAVAGMRVQATSVMVAGVEFEGLGGRLDGSRSDITRTVVSGVSSQFLATRLDWLALATAHFGFLATDRLLIYAKGGVALAHEDHTNNFDFNGVPTVTSTSFRNRGDALHSGSVFGFGGEYAFFGNWSAKLEYNWVHLFTQDIFLPGTIFENSPVLGTGTTSLPNSARIGPSELHLIKFGINYRIGPT